MYRLTAFYGQRAWNHWSSTDHAKSGRASDLRSFRQDSADVDPTAWAVHTYAELVRIVSFLGVMNSRWELAFRGQRSDRFKTILPTLYRETWWPPRWAGYDHPVTITDRPAVLKRLGELGPRVFEVCRRHGLPRWRTMRRVEAAQWSVIQHYELWPTPLVDVTRSVRVAASFALGLSDGTSTADVTPTRGHLYVVALPSRTGSISYSLDEHLLAARLEAVCPPSARRPHLQDGLLVSRFPTDYEQAPAKHYDLRRRVIAHLHLVDDGCFWSSDFPKMSMASLLPESPDDPLAQDFETTFRYVRSDWGLDWELR